MSRTSASEALKEAYHQACNVEGEPFVAFVERVRSEFDAADLLRLIDEVEEAMVANVAMMAEAHPGLELEAEARIRALREELAALRARVGAGD